MARYIDADEFAEAICKFPAIDENAANAVISLLHRQPTADVAEVVRCKDCYYGELSGKGGIICHFGGKWVDEHYCSSAIPRERK